MKKGTAVNYNSGEGNLLALVRGGTGDKTDLVVFGKDGASFENDVPRRDPSDYGAEGGGRTWHPIEG